jgi:cytochrome c oxidase assembly protein subunit 11
MESLGQTNEIRAADGFDHRRSGRMPDDEREEADGPKPRGEATKMNERQRKNRRVVVASLAAIGAMAGLTAYSPNLYRLFCAVTGYGGTTQKADSSPGAVSDRVVWVQFDTNVAKDMPWRFAPEQDKVKVHLGEQKLVFFSAENLSDQPVVGHATYNVAPPTVGAYFKKIQCFCFTEERLAAHEKVDMPVVFFVDPAMAADPTTANVESITLSYTFFRSLAPEKGKDLSRLAETSDPDPERGRRLFWDRCAACHNLSFNMAGPALGGIVGRKAGSAPGYAYSAALRQSEIAWSADSLDRWLADPRAIIAGTKMPVSVVDALDRRDIIAFLAKDSRSAAKAQSGASIAEHKD